MELTHRQAEESRNTGSCEKEPQGESNGAGNNRRAELRLWGQQPVPLRARGGCRAPRQALSPPAALRLPWLTRALW